MAVDGGHSTASLLQGQLLSSSDFAGPSDLELLNSPKMGRGLRLADATQPQPHLQKQRKTAETRRRQKRRDEEQKERKKGERAVVV